MSAAVKAYGAALDRCAGGIIGGPGMDAKEAKAIRRALGLSEAQLGRVLRLRPANAFKTVRNMESGAVDVSGPVSLALEALADGWRPRDYAANVKGGASHERDE